MKIYKNRTLVLARRFDAARVVSNIPVGRLCQEVKTTRHIYKNVMAARTPLPIEWVDHMEQHYGISYAWVLSGRGDMFIFQDVSA